MDARKEDAAAAILAVSAGGCRAGVYLVQRGGVHMGMV